MKILMTGSTGLIGSKTRLDLLEAGHDVYCLVRTRGKMRAGDIYWNPSQGQLDVNSIEGFDAFIHLAGENIASSRWTDEKKKRIRESRVQTTVLLSDAISRLKRKPQVLVSASAIGYYGDRGDELLTEQSSSGVGFLPEVCSVWEKSTKIANDAGVRVANLRIGIVLSPEGGALSKMILPFRMGLGGRIGSGKQFMSWISLDDVSRVIRFVLEKNNLQGPINVVSPLAVPNESFTKALGEVVGRPTFAPLPAFAANLALGEMAKDLLLASIRVQPVKLLREGFVFSDPNLKDTLSSLLRDRSLTDRKFVGECFLPVKREKVFQFFCDPKNLEEITPPWLQFRIEDQSTSEIREGTEFKYNLRIKGVPVRWKSRIENWKPNSMFSDTQLSGPYSRWYHTHRFFDHADGTIMTDEVLYRVPLGFLGNLVGGVFVKRDVDQIFKYREKVIREKFKVPDEKKLFEDPRPSNL